MSLIFEQRHADGVAQLSYIVGDDSAGCAVVIDPLPDCRFYLEAADRHGVAITHVFETHIHADFMSGARELAARAGGAAVCVSEEGGAKYGFDHTAIADGDVFDFGSVRVRAVHTPGHTPEHLAFAIGDTDKPDRPWGILTGDALFVGSIGRPDLVHGQSDDLVRKLFDSIREVFLELDDGVIIYPCHGSGSACGADIGDRPSSTIGYERRFNPFLQCLEREKFIEKVTESSPPEPTHYQRLKRLNADGPPIRTATDRPPALPPKVFHAAIAQAGTVVVDTRDMLAFGGGHIPGALNIGATPELSVWAGWMLDPEKQIFLVTEAGNNVGGVLALFRRTGFTNVVGYLAGGMRAWEGAGYDLQETPQMTAMDIRRDGDKLTVLDVRTPGEWESGHIPDAVHRFLPDMRKRIDGLDKDQPIATYCGSGYRASLAASLLQARGFADVRNVPGSWKAWRQAGYAVAS